MESTMEGTDERDAACNSVNHNHDHVGLAGAGGSNGSALSRSTDPDWDDERRLFLKVLTTFRSYKKFMMKKAVSILTYVGTLPENHQELLAEYKSHLLFLRTCIEVNQNLFLLIIHDEVNLFENHSDVYATNESRVKPQVPTAFDYEKLNGILKQIVRDWAEEGEEERKSCYAPVIEELERQFEHFESKQDIRVLVPGAGTGRLAHEIVRRGYVTEGNEFSMFMLFASNFILNRCFGKGLYKCYPWIAQDTNVLHHDDQIRSATFPDIDPSDLPHNTKFSMTAGDFLDVYGKEEHRSAWDCIVTCFFIDCASNIVAFLERIHYCLKENGVWINIGPLLYHYADLAGESSIQPSYDFLMNIIKKLGFKVLKEEINVPTRFAENRLSMLSFSYKSVFFVCQKPSTNSVNDKSSLNNTSN